MGEGIRIEPDWNVKIQQNPKNIFCMLIRIEPDWNVKVNALPLFFAFRLDQNRTRLECKGG